MRTAALAAIAVGGVVAPVLAAPVEIRVSVENLAPQNSVAFAPLRVGFNSGVYDAFNEGEAAGGAIISIAEGGSGVDWFPAFAAADPTATLGTVMASAGGPLVPGGTGSATFLVDPSVNRFFTFGSMVVPSNDYFIGNDSPTEYQLFDGAGNLLITEITQFGRDIWDAGSELDDPAAAAFIAGGNNDLRTEQGGVVEFDFEGLDIFNGLTTGAGYTFDRQFGANDAVYRIRFEVVPTPGVLAAMGVAGVVGLRRRRSVSVSRI